MAHLGDQNFSRHDEGSFVIGSVGPGSDTDNFPKVISYVFGSKTKLVTGYPGGDDINFATKRGELEGRCG